MLFIISLFDIFIGQVPRFSIVRVQVRQLLHGPCGHATAHAIHTNTSPSNLPHVPEPACETVRQNATRRHTSVRQIELECDVSWDVFEFIDRKEPLGLIVISLPQGRVMADRDFFATCLIGMARQFLALIKP